MAEFAITFARSARKELEKLPVRIANRIPEKIESLGENPRSLGAIKLQGVKNLWRLRVGDCILLMTL